MKTLWTAIGVVAAANILALLALAGYLTATDRLSISRLEQIRDLLSETETAERARVAREQATADAEAEALLAGLPHGADPELGAPAGTPGAVPLSSPELVAQHTDATRLDRQRIERTRREIDDLTRTLRRERVAIDREREQLEQERRAFELVRGRIEEIEGSAQFRKALSVLAGLKADPAREMLEQIIAGVSADGLGTGDREDGVTRAVLYIDALPDRQRTRLMDSFVERDPELAAELLERLRMKGLGPRDPERQGV